MSSERAVAVCRSVSTTKGWLDLSSWTRTAAARAGLGDFGSVEVGERIVVRDNLAVVGDGEM